MEDAVNEYLLSFIDPKDKFKFLKWTNNATENHVPIMDDLEWKFYAAIFTLIGPKAF